MPKDIYSSPRVLLVSWRAPAGKAFSDVGMWLERFQDRMALACDHIQLIDSQKVAENTADMRPESWTDFLAVWTVVYALACKKEVEAGLDSNELQRFLQHIDEGIKFGWIAKLERKFQRDFRIRDVEPWKHQRWNELPDTPEAYFPTSASETDKLDELLVAAIERIGHSPDPDDREPSIETGMRTASLQSQPPTADGTLSRLLQRLRSRNH